MTLMQWFIFFLLVQVIHFLGTWKLYKKAGRQAWEALIPVYNAVILMKIIGRPWWWTILLFIPIVNLIMFPVIWVETARSFGKNTTTDTLLAIVTLGFYLFYINYAADVSYKEARSLVPKSASGEWISSILFAVVAATIVHTYVMQPFTIPTGSLERTLLIGDFLFVSKFHYGARTPMTTVSFPMVHDTIPGLGIKSYLDKPQLPYFRLPGFQDVERSDIVVFSWPVDTVNAFYGLDDGKYYHKPIDKKSNYVKRAVGLPGDSLKVVDGKVFVNNKPLGLPDRAQLQYAYTGVSKSGGFNASNLYNEYKIKSLQFVQGKQFFISELSEENAERFKNHPNVESLERYVTPQGEKEASIFPKGSASLGNVDQIAPVYIPKKGTSTAITPENIPLYKRLIEVYEGEEMGEPRKITVSGNQVMLDGQPITSYTFKQDYYWMMGDNRHNSEDSRFWGFVPENHIVGKPVFIWFSWDSNGKGITEKIRWERLFTTVGGDGKPVSYFLYFVIALIAYLVISKIVKNKRAAKS
ncbi:signal peptidase I [Leeuwenhoekiella parthenopeia]|uniref:Signal peptidase I n=1 Tax=Leeuwenhoekiella parthenopeia TaxID=2890320 RepID=A0ABS8GX96_9FLAO|nr:signal peptidase I [Leeuwenhoekiella parthenopeia]MCC4214572.1 signal peptidase I [Leeuwenhoekiella parthenopeia]